MIGEIDVREILHFLGWRGTPLESGLLLQLRQLSQTVVQQIEPRTVMQRFAIEADGSLAGTSFQPEGKDASALLAPCHEAVLMAATLGAESERMLLRMQAKDAAQALLLDAVLSAAIEAVCDREEQKLRAEIQAQGMYLTDRFSPGYGDTPLEQSAQICAVLRTDRAIGLTVSKSGLMIPRKSVTALLGVSAAETVRRKTGCEACGMKDTCALSRCRAK